MQREVRFLYFTQTGEMLIPTDRDKLHICTHTHMYKYIHTCNVISRQTTSKTLQINNKSECNSKKYLSNPEEDRKKKTGRQKKRESTNRKEK